MAEAARVLDKEYYNHGSAAPAREVHPEDVHHEEGHRPLEAPQSQERIRQRAKAKAAAATQSKSGISFFALVGSVVVTAMMILVVLAQITYSQTTSEAARLSAQLAALNEQHRRLEITFESVIDMAEIERYARDVLGMTRPQSRQTAVIQSASGDRAEVLAVSEQDSLRDFGAFISSLLEQFR